MAVTVTNVVLEGPTFTSGSSAAFAENGTGAVYTAVATPIVSGASVSYSISGGADSAQFSINSSGVVSFKSSPNHESATDAGSDNMYDIVIQATEGGNAHTTQMAVVVTVTDVGEVAPVFTSGNSVGVTENATGSVYTAVATPEVMGAAVSYSISGGLDSAQFSINSSSGVVGFVSSPNHESPTDASGNNVYDIVISATEANNTHTVTQNRDGHGDRCGRCGPRVHQRQQQRQRSRKRYGCGLYRNSHTRCDGCGGVVRHQRH